MKAVPTNLQKFIHILHFVFVTAAVVSLILLWSLWVDDYRTRQYWQEIAELRAENAAVTAEDVLSEYRALYELNHDIVGWLDMEGTHISYPVMQTKNDPEYYLYRNFNEEIDMRGTPFADYRCSVLPAKSFNTIVYGHYANSNLAFRWLLNYSYESWYQKYKRFRFDTLNEKGTYEVVAAFFADIRDARLMADWDAKADDAYTFYNYIELDSKEGFQRYLDGIEGAKLYETDRVCNMKAPILTLICCSPEDFSGIEGGLRTSRFVLVAQQVGRN